MKLALYAGNGVASPYIIDSCRRAFLELGHEVLIVPLNQNPQSIFLWKKKFDADWVIALDHTGIDDKECEKFGQRYCSWFVDFPYYFITEDQVNPFHIPLVSDTAFRDPLSRMGFNSMLHCPLAYDPDLFYKEDLLPGYERLEVCFVGSSFETQEEMNAYRKKVFNSAVNQLIDSTITLMQLKRNLCLWEALKEIEAASGVPCFSRLKAENLGGIIHFVDREVDALRKMEVMEALLPLNIKVYGDQGWLKFLEKRSIYRGAVKYGPELAHIYRKTKVNIVLTRPQIGKGVNQRVFDIPACGGFMLCDYRDELKTLFPEIWERISFKTVKEMKEKTQYFLDNETERLDLAYELNQLISPQTYKNRMKKLTDQLEVLLKISS